MKSRYLLGVIAFLFATACTKNEIINEPGSSSNNEVGTTYPADSTLAITFGLTADYDDYFGTKGSLVNADDQIPTMGVYGYYSDTYKWDEQASAGIAYTASIFNNQEVTNINGVWSYSPVHYWAGYYGSCSSFMAYAPYGTADNGISVAIAGDNYTGLPTLTYTIPTASANQPDLMIANAVYNMNILDFDEDETEYAVPFEMDHTLSAITCSVTGRDDVDYIYVSNAVSSGTMPVNYTGTLSWTLGSGTGDYSILAGNLTETGTVSGGNALVTTNDDGYLMMFPQSTTEDTTIDYYDNVRINIVSDGSRGSVYTSSFPMAYTTDEWEVGEVYNYNYTLSNIVNLDYYDTYAESVNDEGIQGRIAELIAYGYKEVKVIGTYNRYLIQALSEAGEFTLYDLSEVDYSELASAGINIKIHNNLFYGDTVIETIILPNGIDEILSESFSGCTSLTTIVFPEDATIREIAVRTFYGCTSLTNITIPNTVSVFRENAFANCTSLSGTYTDGGATYSIFEDGLSIYFYTGYVGEATYPLGNGSFYNTQVTTNDIPGYITSWSGAFTYSAD